MSSKKKRRAIKRRHLEQNLPLKEKGKIIVKILKTQSRDYTIPLNHEMIDVINVFKNDDYIKDVISVDIILNKSVQRYSDSIRNNIYHHVDRITNLLGSESISIKLFQYDSFSEKCLEESIYFNL